MITSATEIASVRSTSRSDARMVEVRSITTSRSIAAGIEARSTGISAVMRSAVAMMLAPACRPISSTTAGLPLTAPAFLTSCTESVTSATSESLTAAPLRYETITGR
jgi:hypothetical protein